MAPRRSARLKAVQNVAKIANVTTVATSTAPTSRYSAEVRRREDYIAHLRRITPGSVVRDYLSYRSKGFSLVQKALLGTDAIYYSADADAAAYSANSQVCMQRAVKAKEETRRFNGWMITTMKNKQDRKRALQALDKQRQGVWSELPAELFNLVIEKLAESASKEYKEYLICVNSAQEVDALCNRLIPDKWQRRLDCVASLRNNLFEKSIFAIDLAAVVGIQVAPGLHYLERTFALTVLDSLLRYASGMSSIHITLRIGPHPRSYDYGYGVGYDPNDLYAFIDDLERVIEEDFPRLSTIRVTVDDRLVDQQGVFARDGVSPLSSVEYADQIEEITAVISRLKIGQIYQRFLSPSKNPQTQIYGGRYTDARRARGFQSEGGWKSITVNTA
ncbi:hypothetical protein LTR10_014959 [Elasticomyces elasticus]|nr:hypothetical protein LTR10_014959 [Elasticomyces elasticus]KAK4964536.1 hypothetical protein LTR42_012832 [Elasticomyces elasticus]